MPAFDALSHYSPALVLLLGLATFAGSWGTGFLVLRAIRLRVPSPWAEVTAALLGTGAMSLTVQLVAMLEIASRSALVALWATFAAVGSIELLRRAWAIRGRLGVPHELGLLLPGVLLLGAATNLLLAMAPSTKIDELHYQMLPASRIVLDGGLELYLRPWLSAILPQMGYMVAGAPLHAMGVPDAPNVWSWCHAALLTWFGARLVHDHTRSVFAGLLAAASFQIGLYPSVLQVTAGSHALGDLALAGAVLAIVFRDDLLRSCTAAAHLGLLSTCCVLAASAKISLLPLSATVLLLGLVPAIRAAPDDRLRLITCAAIPWAVFYLPACLWTFWQTGSPFGPMLAGVFAPSVFDDAVRAEMAGSRTVNQSGLVAALLDYVVYYPALFPLGALAALLSPTGPLRRRVLLAAIFALQLVITAILLPHQARFLSGLHHALLVVGLIQAWPYAEPWLRGPRLRGLAVAVLLVPWLAVQAYRAWPLASIALGIGGTEDYYRSYIALYDDFRALDRILPADAVLFARGRLPSVYFPRPVYIHYRDLPAGRPAFLILDAVETSLDAPDCGYLRLAPDCRLGRTVYVNPEARFNVFRRPGHAPQTRRIEVRKLLAPDGEPRDRPR